jgi:uncharacterized membrane protein YhaH (DUF805 family)
MLVTPIAAIYTENTERRVKRAKFALWSLAFLLLFFFILEPLLEVLSQTPDTIWSPSLLIIMTGCTIFQALFLRVLVRRLRDAGHDESLAYLSLIPLMNLGLVIYLTFKASAPFRPGSGLNITEDAIS